MGSIGLSPAVTPSDTTGNAQAFADFFRRTGIDVNARVISGTDGPILKSALDHVANQYKKYKQYLKDFNMIKVGGSINALASTNGKYLNLNTAYFGDTNTLNLVYQASVDSGFHPKGTTWENIVDHEMGHAVTWGIIQQMHGKDANAARSDWLNNTNSGTAGKMVNAAIQEIQDNYQKYGYSKKPGKGELRNEISEYAAKNHHETIAEAWADYHANGKNAKPLSRVLYKTMRSYVKNNKPKKSTK